MNDGTFKSPPRRSVLDLAPLELDCMNTLWPMGEGTVREIRDRLAARRPRAYTTIMTIMDRLARKGVVERRKVGRAYFYRPHLSAEDARSQALRQVVENFFDGSTEALLAQLATSIPGTRSDAAAGSVPVPLARARAAAAGASTSTQPVPLSPPPAIAASPVPFRAPETQPAPESDPDGERIDDTLL